MTAVPIIVKMCYNNNPQSYMFSSSQKKYDYLNATIACLFLNALHVTNVISSARTLATSTQNGFCV